MATVVQGARTTGAGIASSRLKVDMGDLYKLEDNQGALYVTANLLGRGKAANYEVRWHTSELRPKSTTLSVSAATADTSIVVATSDTALLNVNDLINIRGLETALVTGVTSNTAAVIRSWGADTAVTAATGTTVTIIAPHYAENATLQNARSVTEVSACNYTAIFRHNLETSETLRAIGDAGGTYHGPDLETQREDMMLVHKRDINLACLFSEIGSSGTRRSMMGLKEFIDGGTSRTDSTSALTFAAFMQASETMTRYNQKKMVGVISRRFATIVSQWAITTSSPVQVENGADMFGLQVMNVTTPHGKFKLLIDDALTDNSVWTKYGFFIATDKKGGPKWKYLRDTVLLKNRQDPDQDGYEEEVLTEGTVEWGNANYHFYFDNVQAAA
jgi:hypothetical protein